MKILKLIILLSTFFVINIGCKKDTPPKSATISLGNISFTSNTASIEINITDDGNASIMECGIYYKSSPGALSGTKITANPGKGLSTIQIPGLKKATKYYLVGYATNSVGTTYTQEISFNTTPELATITALTLNTSITLVDPISGKYIYNISDDGGATLTARGICWNTTGNPTIADNKKSDTTTIGSINGTFNNLKPNTKYYFKAFATNSVGTNYSNELTYTTDKLNSCFQNPLIFDASNIYIVKSQIDGKIIVGGSNFTKLNGKDINYLIRLNKDGIKDSTFNFTYDMSSSTIYAPSDKSSSLNIQGDKMILVLEPLGPATQTRKVIRLNSDGTLDKTFYIGNIHSSSSGQLTTYDILPNGKIIFVGNTMNSYNDILINGIVCLNNDGTIDNNFKTGTGFDSKPTLVIALPTGKMIIGGHFTTYNGTSVNNLVRLNSDGSLDNTFNANITNNVIYKVTYSESLNKFYVDYSNSGTFGSFVRLNYDGSLDNTFTPGSLGANSGNNKTIYTLELQQDGKILIGGAFSTYNNKSYTNSLLRLNTDGTVDNTFNIGTGFGNLNSTSGGGISVINVLSDKSVILGGSFSLFNGAPVKYFTKLNSDFTTCGY